LPTDLFARAAFYVDLLAEQGPLLGEPYTKQIDGKLRELRFWLDRDAMRISYWIATDRRIVLLTVFRKTRMRETREIDRAVKAYRRCVAEAHTVSVTEEDQVTGRTGWDEIRRNRMTEPGAEKAYDATRRAFELGAAVRQMREQRGWTQTRLADAAGMTQSALARFEAGGTVPTLALLERIAQAFQARLVVRFDEGNSAA